MARESAAGAFLEHGWKGRIHAMRVWGSLDDLKNVDRIFMDTEEKKTAVIGEGSLCRFLHDGILKSGFCVLTDKRVYFKGCYLQKTGRAYQASKGEYTIDLKDVTGSGFSTTRFGIVFLMGILYVLVMTVLTGLFLLFVSEVEHYHFEMAAITRSCEILLVVGLAAVPVCYYLKPFRIFVIEYASGKIAFLANEYLENDMRLFQRELYKAKDACAAASAQEKPDEKPD